MENFTNSQKLFQNTTSSNEGVNQDNTYNKTLMSIVSVLLFAALMLIMVSMGCTVDLKKLWAHLKRPWALAVSMVCQFVFMPLIAFTLTISFALKPASAIAVLIMGSCPGGTISNVMSYWTDGDMDLSISMTVCSTFLAIGFMPLSLYIYSTTWTEEFNSSSIASQARNITVPYKEIGTSLISLIIPISFGIFVARKWPKQSKIILKVGTGIGASILIVLAVVTSLLHKGPWNADLPLFIIGIINPLIGYMTGFILAVLVQQSWTRCRTIALETGIQNGNLCATILMISFKEQLSSMFAYPFIYICFQIFHGLVFVTAYQIYKRLKKPSAGPMDSSQSVI
ncbi:solute carrier family 10 member 6-like [Carcharodon carcharias]|uniref:solute carrier family 10 member 6-like n=1 Tax=Carcharodon carcharias TaxID=13397 RepID=UPI001B7F5F23|nr:solute carrier family 10 member 6-like [Carcharodon carcharias]